MEELNAENVPLNKEKSPLKAEESTLKAKKSKLNVNNLPLDIREHLMRGEHHGAVKLLKEKHGMKRKKAEQLIEEYRQNLRDRKIALDIQIIRHQQEKEMKEQHHIWWTWGMRIALSVFTLVILYLTVGYLAAGSTF